jgi:hypothetical protein
MKRFAILLAIFVTAFLINLGVADADRTVENRVSTDYRPQKPATEMPPTYIDGVPVPYEILVYAQVVYQGYAVTQAEETTFSGKKAYQLRIDNDSNPHDSNGMYLLYDSSWELIDKKPLYAPLPKERKTGAEDNSQEPEPPQTTEQTTDETSENENTEPTAEENNENQEPGTPSEEDEDTGQTGSDNNEDSTTDEDTDTDLEENTERSNPRPRSR